MSDMSDERVVKARTIGGDGGSPSRASMMKARLMGLDREQAREGGEREFAFAGVGVLSPPYDPADLLYWARHSASIRPNVAAMIANIDAHGHRLDPVLRLDTKDSRRVVADALIAARFNAGDDDPAEPAEEEVDAEIARLARRMRLERAKADSFVRHAAHDGSLVRIRSETRWELECTGNAYWEVLRNQRGEPGRFKRTPSHLMRLMPLDVEWTDVPEWEQLSPVHFERVDTPRRLRRFVQTDEVTGEVRYFKAWRDPRVLSSRTGIYYASIADLRTHEPQSVPANEIIHFRLFDAETPYGVPRWIPATPEVGGRRAAAEVNYWLFENKSVPPVAILVSGGRLAEGADAVIKEHVKKQIQGTENWHQMLVLEAESTGNSGTAAKIEIIPLSQAVQDDGLFLKYDQHAALTVGSQWRIPRIIRGDTEDFNRATADAALRMAEDQVFGPPRDEFDHLMNGEVLPELGIRTWRFRSMSPSSRDPERLAKLIKAVSEAGGLVPRDARKLAQDVFNERLDPIDEPWQGRPLTFTLAGIQTSQGSESVDAGKDDNLDKQARDLLGVRRRLAAREQEAAEHRSQMARDLAQPKVIKVPDDVFDEWFDSED